MTRTGYILAGILVAVLLAWVVWPSGDAEESRRVLEVPAGPPESFVLEGPAPRQEVDVEAGTVHFPDGLVRPLDEGKVGGLWGLWHRLRSQRRKPEVARADLGAYGIGPDRRLAAEGVELRWGRTEEHAYVWNGADRTVHVFHPDTYATIERHSGRLDDRRLVHLPARMRRVTLDDEVLERHHRICWRDADGKRPAFTGRVHRLENLLELLTLEELDGAAVEDFTPNHRLRIDLDDGGRVEVELQLGDDAGFVRVPGLPVQRLRRSQHRAWRRLLRDFDRDLLCDEWMLVKKNVLDRIEVRRGDTPWFVVERRLEGERLDTRAEWEVRWQEGQEPAVPDAGDLFERALAAVRVADPVSPDRTRASADEGAEDLIEIVASGHTFKEVIRLRLRGDNAGNGRFSGTLVDPPALLSELSPDRFLDTILLGEAPERIVKFQRVRFEPDGPAAEVYRRSGTGGWRRVYPEEAPADRLAMQQVLRLLCRGDALRSAQADAADREILARPEREIAVRLEARTRAEGPETVDLVAGSRRDWAIRLAHRDGSWRAVHVEGLRAFDLSAAMVEGLFAPLRERLVYPITPSLVINLTVVRGGEAYVLVPTDRRGERWELRWSDGTAPAETLQVRRYLQTLAGLVAERVEAGHPGLTDETAVGKVTAELPGITRSVERLTLFVGEGRDGLVPVTARSSGQDTGGLPGRAWVRPPEAIELLPPREHLRRAAAPPEGP